MRLLRRCSMSDYGNHKATSAPGWKMLRDNDMHENYWTLAECTACFNATQQEWLKVARRPRSSEFSDNSAVVDHQTYLTSSHPCKFRYIISLNDPETRLKSLWKGDTYSQRLRLRRNWLAHLQRHGGALLKIKDISWISLMWMRRFFLEQNWSLNENIRRWFHK